MNGTFDVYDRVAGGAHVCELLGNKSPIRSEIVKLTYSYIFKMFRTSDFVTILLIKFNVKISCKGCMSQSKI